MSLPPPRTFGPAAPSWRWLASWIWWVEHAFERARADERPEEDTRVRIFVVLALFTVLFSGLVIGATRAALFSNAHVRVSGASGAALGRADVTDRNGLLLASNIVHYGLYIDPAEVWDREGAITAVRRALPRVPVTRLRTIVQGESRGFVMGGLSPQEKRAVHDLALGGVYFEPEDRRIYPLGASAAHLIGFSDSAGEGLAGAERAFNTAIRAGGRAGEPFALSIDLRIQGVLENELRAAAIDQQVAGAVGIVTDIRTGEVLAMASYPDFDPNQPGAADPEAMRNRVAASVYEMGSTFKIFTVAAGIDAGVADLSTTFDAEQPLHIGNRAIRDFHAENRVMTLEEVFLKSSNIGTSRLAMMMGPAVMRRYFDGLGLFAAAPIELAESARPVMPPDFSDSTISSMSFGHAIMVSPLQMAAAVGAVMNGGRRVPLTLRRLSPGARIEASQVITPTTSAAMLDLMRRNVVNGSGRRADAPGLRVGGKTGSAEKVINGRYSKTTVVSSFAAVFPTDGPIDGPRYLVLILMDEPHGSAQTLGQRTAGFTAAPVAGRVIDRIAGFVGVARAADQWRTATGDRIPEPEDTTGAAL
jgi:cell division protein FtsI (penicillin-binding protein 3)